MRKVWVLGVVLAAVLMPASASATELVTPGAERFPYQSWADAAKVPTPPGALSVSEEVGPCPPESDLACATRDGIWMHTDQFGWGTQAQKNARFTFLHELGHVYDIRVMGDVYRGEIMRLLHLSPPWKQPELTNGSPNETFADAYAFCALRPQKLIRHANGIGSILVGWRRMRELCYVIRTS